MLQATTSETDAAMGNHTRDGYCYAGEGGIFGPQSRPFVVMRVSRVLSRALTSGTDVATGNHTRDGPETGIATVPGAANLVGWAFPGAAFCSMLLLTMVGQ